MSTVLTVLTSWSTDPGDAHLGDDLVRQLEIEGHGVTTIAFTAHGRRSAGTGDSVHLVPLVTSLPIVKYVLAWPWLIALVARLRLRHPANHFDHLIVQAPLTVRSPVLLLLLLFDFQHRTAILFDIYPLHQTQIGALPAVLEPLLRRLEHLLLSRFDVVTVMGLRNRQAVLDYYFHNTTPPEIRIVPPWTPPAASDDLPHDRAQPDRSGPARLIFGGQIIRGRRMDRLIEFLGLLRSAGQDLSLSIYSSGPGFEQLRDRFGHEEWVNFHPRVDRHTYTRLLREYDVGVVVTDDRVTLPALPSKIVDYSNAGLASFCMVEERSELFTTAADVRCVHLNDFDLSAEAVDRATGFLAYALTSTAEQEARTFADRFRVHHATAEIMR